MLFIFAIAAALVGQLIRIDAGIIKSNYHACICAMRLCEVATGRQWESENK